MTDESEWQEAPNNVKNEWKEKSLQRCVRLADYNFDILPLLIDNYLMFHQVVSIMNFHNTLPI